MFPSSEAGHLHVLVRFTEFAISWPSLRNVHTKPWDGVEQVVHARTHAHRTSRRSAGREDLV